MSTISEDLKSAIIRHLEASTPAKVFSIASALCEPESRSPPPAADTFGVRFIVRDNSMVEDTSSGLIWTRDDVGTGRLNWADAKKACAALSLGGHRDWRLPTIRELLTLVDYERSEPSINTIEFPSCKSDWYWSATPYASSPGGYAWYVSFSSGDASVNDQDLKGLVRAVRARQ